MTVVTCPRCNAAAVRGGFPVWTIVVSIVLFPFGLLALLAGRKPSVCSQCGFVWQA